MYSVRVKVYAWKSLNNPFDNMFIWFGDHSGGDTPGLVSIPEVKSSCVLNGTIMSFMGSSKRCRPLSYLHLTIFLS